MEATMSCRITFVLVLLANVASFNTALADPLGPEFRVNSFTSGDQTRPKIAELTLQRHIVVWESNGQYGSGTAIFGKRYKNSGAESDEFRISTFTQGDQVTPAVAAINGGGHVVAWAYKTQTGRFQVYARRYFPDAISPTGPGFYVHTTTTRDQTEPAVAGLYNGGFVIAWASYKPGDNFADILAQRFNASGSKRGAQFRVNSFTEIDIRHNPSIASLGENGFVIVWESQTFGGPIEQIFPDIFGQRFNLSGEKVGSQFRVNENTLDSQSAPQVAGLSGGAFVVVFTDNQQLSRGVKAQRFDSSGAKVGPEILVSSSTAQASVARRPNGGFVVVWGGVQGQKFDASGERVGDVFQVNGNTESAKELPSVAPIAGVGFFVTWVSDGQDGSGKGAYGRRFGQ
jgi:hypothetical protein